MCFRVGSGYWFTHGLSIFGCRSFYGLVGCLWRLVISFASGRIIQVAVLLQTDCKSGEKGVSGMRSLPSDIPQDTQNAVQQGRRRTLWGTCEFR
jgi:hypothetical protein